MTQGPAGTLAQRTAVYAQNVTPTGTILSEPDARVVAAARVGNGEVWSFDRAFRNNPARIQTASASALRPKANCRSRPQGAPNGSRFGRRLLGLPPVEISLNGTVYPANNRAGPGGGAPPGGAPPPRCPAGGPTGSRPRGTRRPPPRRRPSPRPPVPRWRRARADSGRAPHHRRAGSGWWPRWSERTPAARRRSPPVSLYSRAATGLLSAIQTINTVGDILNMHASGTVLGDAQQAADRTLPGADCPRHGQPDLGQHLVDRGDCAGPRRDSARRHRGSVQPVADARGFRTGGVRPGRRVRAHGDQLKLHRPGAWDRERRISDAGPGPPGPINGAPGVRPGDAYSRSNGSRHRRDGRDRYSQAHGFVDLPARTTLALASQANSAAWSRVTSEWCRHSPRSSDGSRRRVPPPRPLPRHQPPPERAEMARRVLAGTGRRRGPGPAPRHPRRLEDRRNDDVPWIAAPAQGRPRRRGPIQPARQRGGVPVQPGDGQSHPPTPGGR